MIQLFKPNITEQAIDEVAKVLRSGWIGLGPKTQEFEEAFAKYVGAKYCAALNSCTAALHLAVKLLDLPEGSEVITTPITFVSTNVVLLYERLVPVFADVEYGTLNIDVRDIERKITKKTKAIMIVHYGGQPCDLDEICQLADYHNLAVIQDAAHACGAMYKGKKIGSVSIKDLCCWSFHAVKNLPTGDGGAITTNDKSYYERLKQLRWVGIDKDTFMRTKILGKESYAWQYSVNEIGYKYHMNDITAAIAVAQLKVLDEHNARRKEIVDVYMRELREIELPVFKDDRVSSNHLFEIKVKNRDTFLARMKERDIACGAHYYPNNLYPVFPDANLPVVESVYEHIVSLPLHTLLSDKDVLDICKAVKENSIIK